MILKKISINYSLTHFMEIKTMENVRYRLKKFIKKDDTNEIIKQQSKLTFNGIHKSYEICDSFSFKENEIKMDKPSFLGFAVLKLSKIL